MQQLGDRLAAWRRAKGLSQAELAARAGVTQAMVSRIESRGRDFSVRTLVRLAAAAGVTPSALLELDPPRPVLDRFQVDAVMRAVVSGRRTHLSRDLAWLADACAAQCRPVLEACAAPGARRAGRLGLRAFRNAQRTFGAGAIRLILSRLPKTVSAPAGVVR